MTFNIPQSLKNDHRQLHEELAKVMKAGGKVAEAAQAVAALLHPHFIKEEEYALPPLGLLDSLAANKIAPEMENVLQMTNRLTTELHEMLGEHKAIVAALAKLTTAAIEENEPECRHFVDNLMLHAQTEEEVLYPAAIVVGEYVRLRLGK
jgi:hypothetical protein